MQRSAVGTIGAIDLMHVAVVGSRLDNARQERGRRICLERLLWELDQLGVASVTMDRRSGHLNARDLALVDAMRARNTLGHGLRIDFQPSFDGVDGEILLWIPDVVAGAITAAQGDGRPEFLGPIARQVVDITVDLGGQSAKPRS